MKKLLTLNLTATAVLLIMLAMSSGVASAKRDPIYTFNDLQAAINSAPADGAKTTIKMSGDIGFPSSFTIENGQDTTIQSVFGNSYMLVQSANSRHLTVEGGLTRQDTVLKGGVVFNTKKCFDNKM